MSARQTIRKDRLPFGRTQVNRLLKLTAIIEAATGLALMAVPSVVVRLLLGGEISGASVALGRVGGFALLSLGMACWPGRDSDVNTASAVRAMLAYNSLTTLYLLCLGIGGEWVGLPRPTISMDI